MFPELLYLVSKLPIKFLPGTGERRWFDSSQSMLCIRAEVDKVAIDDGKSLYKTLVSWEEPLIDMKTRKDLPNIKEHAGDPLKILASLAGKLIQINPR